jgi:hypothetical protein
MNIQNNPPNKPKQSTEAPMLLRMLHPTSGREGFNEVINPTAFPSQVPIDPRLAMMINMQTQQAIAASGIPIRAPYQGFTIPRPSPYMYGVQQPYAFLPRRS